MKNVKEHISEDENAHLKMPSKAKTPLAMRYQPELDVSPELTLKDASYYQSLIGILRWIIELWWIDICLEVSMMSLHLPLPQKDHHPLPQKDHLDQVLHIVAYL